MKASKRKKKLRWLEQESRNGKRARATRNLARAQAEKDSKERWSAMNREALRDKLVGSRQVQSTAENTTGKSRVGNGLDSVLPGLRNVEGKKLKEAASYLDSARRALLNWTRDTCTSADNLDTHADHLQEVLATCATLQRMKTTIEFKAHLYGETT